MLQQIRGQVWREMMPASLLCSSRGNQEETHWFSGSSDSVVCVSWNGWDGRGQADALQVSPWLQMGWGREEKCCFPLLSSQSASLHCYYWDYQTSASISRSVLVTSLIIILPYIPGQRLTKRNVIIWFPLTQPSGKSAFQSSGCIGNKPEITTSIFSDFLITVSINMASRCKAR